MSLDDLRSLSESFGEVLQVRLAELEKRAEIHGGGLRHGEVEWQVSYEYRDLRRILVFNLGELAGDLVTVSGRAVATDGHGQWATAPAASTSIPYPIIEDQLVALVPDLLDHTRFIANGLDRSHLRPMVLTGAPPQS